MLSPARLSAIMRPFLEVLVAIFVIGCIVTWLQGDDYEDDEFSVTLTYDCTRVLTERNYPADVTSECLELRDELRKRNK